MDRWPHTVFAVLLTLGTVSAAAPPATLVQGARVEKPMRVGARHVYRLRLNGGDFLRVTVGQRNLDVVARVSAPDGRESLVVDNCKDVFRPETIALIADVQGSYTLTIELADASPASGRYTLTVDAIRPPSQADGALVEAERAFARGTAGKAAREPKAFAQAVDELTAAIRTYQELGERQREAAALLEIAFLQARLGRADAERAAKDAERIARELEDQAFIGAALQAYAASADVRDPEAAGEAAEGSMRIGRAIGHRRLEAMALNSQGISHGRQGHGEAAVALFEQAAELARASQFASLESAVLNNLGIAYKNLGEYEKALRAYRLGLPLARRIGDLYGLNHLYNNLGNVERLLGRHHEGLAAHREALALARSTGDRPQEARALNTIGQALSALGDHARALEYHRQGLAIRRGLDDVGALAASLTSEGRTLHRLGDLPGARASLREALEHLRRIKDQLGELDALAALAAVERDAGAPDAAREYLEEALRLEDRLRRRITSPALRASFGAAEQDKHELMIDLLLDAYDDPAEALAVSERARARVLLETVLDPRVDLRQGIDPALLARERSLQQQLSAASSQLTRALGNPARAEQARTLGDRVEQLDRDYQQLQVEIRRQSPRYADVTQPAGLTAAEIQREVLDDETVILEFALGEKRSWLFAVTREAIATAQLPGRAAIDAATRVLHTAITARQKRVRESAAARKARLDAADAAFAREAARLSRMLLGGVADSLADDWHGRRLAIVATGSLEYVPFAALPLPGRKEPLVAKHEIVLVPSASVLAASRRERPARAPATPRLAIFADPVFGRDDPRARQAAAPSRRPAPVARREPIPAPAIRGGLARLPFSREEARAIASLAEPGNVLLATDFDASRSGVLDGRLAGYRIVHFATHGAIDDARPGLSALVLSLIDRQGRPVNGYLRLHDIYNLQLDADLVVLSACQTALGKEIKGEGLIGLARAFMYAGAPTIVASVWNVNDLATAELMKIFYRGVLTEQRSPAAALRQAQMTMARHPRWRSPYYWAGFRVQGDWK